MGRGGVHVRALGVGHGGGVTQRLFERLDRRMVSQRVRRRLGEVVEPALQVV